MMTASFTLDTRQMREILDGVPLNAPEVSEYILEYLTENKQETDKGAILCRGPVLLKVRIKEED